MEVLFTSVPLIGLLIVALAIYAIRSINQEKKSRSTLNDKNARIPFMLGILTCLIGACLMAFGEGLLGENHTGIATVIGVVGIGLIGTSGAIFTARSTPLFPDGNSNGGKHVE